MFCYSDLTKNENKLETRFFCLHFFGYNELSWVYLGTLGSILVYNTGQSSAGGIPLRISILGLALTLKMAQNFTSHDQHSFTSIYI